MPLQVTEIYFKFFNLKTNIRFHNQINNLDMSAAQDSAIQARAAQISKAVDASEANRASAAQGNFLNKNLKMRTNITRLSRFSRFF